MFCWEIEWRSPDAAFAPLAGEPHGHLLHGGERSDAAEWSIVVAFPTEVIAHDNADGEGWLEVVQAMVDARALAGGAPAIGTPFSSGLVGFVGYEALAALEPTLNLPVTPYALPAAMFGVYDAAAVFSRKTKAAYVIGRCEKACARLKSALGKDALTTPSAPQFSSLASNFTRRAYEASVSEIIEKILDGDFYQANISQQLLAMRDEPFSPFDLFRFVTKDSDAFFGALMQYKEGAIVSNSPERFFRLSPQTASGQNILVEPVKGTRKRSLDIDEDAALAIELQSDPKDRAENIMIADLMRNDLSKICKDGSINEDAICDLMSLSRVHHLVSRISGDLREDITITDVFRALFPSGSVTGAPKIEAMNAIAGAEEMGRGPYCGAIGYIDDRGRADFSVSIRTMTASKDGRRLTIPVGGGVTLQSDPYKEYEETLIKAIGSFGAVETLIDGLS